MDLNENINILREILRLEKSVFRVYYIKEIMRSFNVFIQCQIYNKTV